MPVLGLLYLQLHLNILTYVTNPTNAHTRAQYAVQHIINYQNASIVFNIIIIFLLHKF